MSNCGGESSVDCVVSQNCSDAEHDDDGSADSQIVTSNYQKIIKSPETKMLYMQPKKQIYIYIISFDLDLGPNVHSFCGLQYVLRNVCEKKKKVCHCSPIIHEDPNVTTM